MAFPSIGQIARGLGKAGRTAGAIGQGVERFKTQQRKKTLQDMQLEATRESIKTSKFNREEKEKLTKEQEAELFWTGKWIDHQTTSLNGVKTKEQALEAINSAMAFMKATPPPGKLAEKTSEFMRKWTQDVDNQRKLHEENRNQKLGKATGKFEAASALDPRQVQEYPMPFSLALDQLPKSPGTAPSRISKQESGEAAFSRFREGYDPEFIKSLEAGDVDPETYFNEQQTKRLKRYEGEDKRSDEERGRELDLQNKEDRNNPKHPENKDRFMAMNRIQKKLVEKTNSIVGISAGGKELIDWKFTEDGGLHIKSYGSVTYEDFKEAWKTLEHDEIMGTTIARHGLSLDNMTIVPSPGSKNPNDGLPRNPSGTMSVKDIENDAKMNGTSVGEEIYQGLKNIQGNRNVPPEHLRYYEDLQKQYPYQPPEGVVEDTASYRHPGGARFEPGGEDYRSGPPTRSYFGELMAAGVEAASSPYERKLSEQRRLQNEQRQAGIEPPPSSTINRPEVPLSVEDFDPAFEGEMENQGVAGPIEIAAQPKESQEQMYVMILKDILANGRKTPDQKDALDFFGASGDSLVDVQELIIRGLVTEEEVAQVRSIRYKAAPDNNLKNFSPALPG